MTLSCFSIIQPLLLAIAFILQLFFTPHLYAGTACEKKLVLDSNLFWSELNSKIVKRITENIKTKENLPSIYLNLGEKHPHIRYLKKLGFVLDGKQPKVPSVIEIFNAYEDFLKNKNIDKADILKPRFAFVKGKSFKYLKFGEQIPKGYRHHHEGIILNAKDYYRAIRKGFFPMGSMTEAHPINSRFTSFEHDLAHLTAYMESPEYMAQIKILAELKKVKNHFLFTIPPGKKMNDARYYLNEGMEFVSPEGKKALVEQALLDSSFTEDPYSLTVHQAYIKIKELPSERLARFTKNISDNFSAYFTAYGGAGRDPVNHMSFDLHSPMHFLFEKITVFHFMSGGIDIKALAEFYVSAFRLMKLNHIQWFDDYLSQDFYSTKTSYFLRRIEVESESGSPFIGLHP